MDAAVRLAALADAGSRNPDAGSGIAVAGPVIGLSPASGIWHPASSRLAAFADAGSRNPDAGSGIAVAGPVMGLSPASDIWHPASSLSS